MSQTEQPQRIPMPRDGLGRQFDQIYEAYKLGVPMDQYHDRAAKDMDWFYDMMSQNHQLSQSGRERFNKIIEMFPDLERKPEDDQSTQSRQGGIMSSLGNAWNRLTGRPAKKPKKQSKKPTRKQTTEESETDPFDGIPTRQPTPAGVMQTPDTQGIPDVNLGQLPPPLDRILHDTGGNNQDFNLREMTANPKVQARGAPPPPADESSTDSSNDPDYVPSSGDDDSTSDDVGYDQTDNYRLGFRNNAGNLKNRFGSVPVNWKAAYDAANPSARPSYVQRQFYTPEGKGKSIKRQTYTRGPETWKRDGYTDTMNEIGKYLGIQEGEDLSKVLPKEYLGKNIKNVYKQDTMFYDPENAIEKPTGERPTEEELAYVEMLKQGGRPFNEAVIGRTRRNMAGNVPPLSQSAKTKARTKAQTERIAARAKWQDTLKEGVLGKALAAAQKVRAWNRFDRHDKLKKKQYYDPDAKQWVDQDENYLRAVTALRNVKHKLPASITRPEYMGWLGSKEIEGVPWDDQSLGGTILGAKGYGGLIQADMDAPDGNIEGYTWQTVDPDTRNWYMAKFAEMVGILNARPVFDQRLVSPESAAYVYPVEDFDIKMINFDKNRLTPAQCVVSTKKSMKLNGVQLPAGSIIAVGGWSFANASEAYSTNQLKNILYYSRNPTKDQRRANPRNAWLNVLLGDPASRRENTKNLKFIVDHLKVVFEARGAQLPYLYQEGDNSKNMTVPTFMKLIRGTDGKVVAYLSMNAFAFRTYLTRVAELFFNL